MGGLFCESDTPMEKFINRTRMVAVRMSGPSIVILVVCWFAVLWERMKFMALSVYRNIKCN